MTETKFTPGPWAAEPDGIYAGRKPVAVAVDGYVYDEITSDPASLEATEDDMSLILAAPDLYSALHEAVLALAMLEDHPLTICQRGATALAKARGETA